MTNKRRIEIFSANCPLCQKTIELVKSIACQSCDIRILDMNNNDVAKRAEELNIQSVPTVVVDGKVVGCCSGRGPSKEELMKSGIGQPCE